MPIDLDTPLRWSSANADEKALLADLQGNILKGHGRKQTKNMFLQFGNATDGRSFIKQAASLVVSAQKQLQDADAFKKGGADGGPVVFILLSALGYKALGIAPAQIPGDTAFAAGLKANAASLNDPPPEHWDETFQADVHAMLIIGATAAQQPYVEKQLKGFMAASVKVLGSETGKALFNKNGDGIEHFGYVDGRSQPLVLVEDIERERDITDGISVWDPAVGLKQALVPCPGGDTNSFGSYLVFRKLDQNVKGFKEMEDTLAKTLGLSAGDAERAGAMVVGRFEDGTPVVLQNADGSHHPVPNNFTYKDDPGGQKCPFQGHIRKSNPRGESVGTFAADLEEERAHLILRRGIPFGDRNEDLSDRPAKDVGLLFMCYQSDIQNQFEFIQRFWVNNGGFVQPGTGIDPVIGQGASTPQSWPTGWGQPEKKDADFHGFVTMRGGEYFFAPCIGFLKSL